MKHQSHALTATLLAAGTVGVLGLSACSNEGEVQEPSVSSASSATSAVSQASIDSAPAAANDDVEVPGDYSTDPKDTFTGSSMPALRTTDIRVGSHEGFERIVFEFEGEDSTSGTPEYSVAYNPEPTQQASGYPVEVPGGAALEVFIHGTSLDESADAKYAGKTTLGLTSGPIVDVVNGGSFEGVSQYFIAVDEQRPFKVSVLDNPTRIVVDVQN